MAIIPARGGSKRIPRKNIKLFCGKPIIVYSIEAALSSKVFDKVIVSTDDQEIAEIAEKNGASVPFLRPSSLSTDETATAPVIAHAIDWLKADGIEVSEACCIYATAPFVQPADILNGFEKMQSGLWDFVFSATAFEFPIFRSFKCHSDNSVEMFFPSYYAKRSQDLPRSFHDAGQFYWGSAIAWRENRKIFDRMSSVVHVPRWRSQDIDDMEDWARAEIMMEVIKKSN